MIVLGLTGSIGMGKSTTARMFVDAGVPVYDADAAVHALYAGEAAPLIEAAFPGTVRDGVVDRNCLSTAVLGRDDAMRRLEAIVHPLVREDRLRFLAEQRAAGAPLVVLDIPLLFEGGGERDVDRTLVVTADPEIQRQRVLARPGMSEDRFRAVLARQMPDAEKRRRADYIIDSGLGMQPARDAVARIIGELTAKPLER